MLHIFSAIHNINIFTFEMKLSLTQYNNRVRNIMKRIPFKLVQVRHKFAISCELAGISGLSPNKSRGLCAPSKKHIIDFCNWPFFCK